MPLMKAIQVSSPVVEVFPLEQAAVAFERMMTARVHFRAVLKMGDGSNE